QENNMTLEQVFAHNIKFMHRQPAGKYSLMVRTDSQVQHKQTLFITGSVIRNKGKGEWSCMRKLIIPRNMLNLHERIAYETSITEEIVSLFNIEKKSKLIDIVLPHINRGTSFKMEGHIDIGSGKKNKTRQFVQEMIRRMES